MNLSVCVYVCVSIASCISKTSEATAIKFDEVRMHITYQFFVAFILYGHMNVSCNRGGGVSGVSGNPPPLKKTQTNKK